MEPETRILCVKCGHVCPIEEMLTAQNPFDLGEVIEACPKCKEIDSCVGVCHQCDKQSTFGTPTKNGYVRSCYEHIPKGDK